MRCSKVHVELDSCCSWRYWCWQDQPDQAVLDVKTTWSIHADNWRRVHFEDVAFAAQSESEGPDLGHRWAITISIYHDEVLLSLVQSFSEIGWRIGDLRRDQ